MANEGDNTIMIRIGIVGCGRILNAHLQGYRQLMEAGFDNFRITALCARQEADALDSRLAASRRIILFPEGTTSDGTGVRPFRSSLLAAAGRGDWPCVQPVTIRYRTRDGMPLTRSGRRGIAWLDEDELLPHAFGLAARGGVLAEIIFEKPVASGCRKELAELCRTAIAARLAEPDGDAQAATLKRAA